jgi:co-chaperonin GroES (HSP10)
MTDLSDLDIEQTLTQAFPDVDPGFKPYGSRVLVQVRAVKEKVSSAGILLPEETKDVEKWNCQVGKVIALGPLAFCKRDSMEPWPEGAWAKVGDYVRIIKWGGDKWEVPFTDETGLHGQALFAVFNDHEIIGSITADPRKMVAFL